MALLPLSVRQSLLVLSNILIPLACLVFATGFFPYKPLLPELATFEAQEAAEEIGLLSERRNGAPLVQRPGRLFDKVIFMVVDALRSDFVYGEHSGFQFVQSLIRDGGAYPFTAHAAAPTVTMPRVKALTTGSVPSFADLILNLDESDTSSSLAFQDTWLAQIRQHLPVEQRSSNNTGKIAFYGDDTWIKLFPDFFSIHDGTSSFFVSDFTEVDNNVTRHIPSTLKSKEWDAMIMHYLGLDHIGHKTGPLGPNMLPKQREMDGIVKQIYTAMDTQPHLKDTLLVLAGDHGMNSAGNHGGSGAGETSTALLFASPKLGRRARATKRKQLLAPAMPRAGSEFDFYTKIQQSDLVPTLSILLDVPIPKNSLGVVIPDLLDLYWDGVLKSMQNPYLQLLYRNALQVLEIVKATYGVTYFTGLAGQSMNTNKCSYGYTEMIQLQCLWGRAQRMVLAGSLDERFTVKEQSQALKDFLLEAQKTLSATASSYKVSRLIGGIVIAFVASITAFWCLPRLHADAPTVGFALITLLYGVMMFASSYVEEEQHIWYWATGAWFAVLAVLRLRKSPTPLLSGICGVTLLLLHRIANRWNQTGQKHAGEPDIAKNLLPLETTVLWVVATMAYIGFSRQVLSSQVYSILPWPLLQVLLAVTVHAGLIFKFNFTLADAPELVGPVVRKLEPYIGGKDLVFQAQLTFASIALLVVLSGLAHFKQPTVREQSVSVRLVHRLAPLLGFVVLTQSRVTNIALFFLYQRETLLLQHIIFDDSPPVEVEWIARHVSKVFSASSAFSGNAALRVVASEHSIEKTFANTTPLTILLLTYASFFQLGNSNAISSIDLSQAYNGISSYNMTAVGILLFLSNWAGPIFWTTRGIALLYAAKDDAHRTRLVRSGAGNGKESRDYTNGNGASATSAVDQLDELLDDPLISVSNGSKGKKGGRRQSRQSTEPQPPGPKPVPAKLVPVLKHKAVSTDKLDSPYQQYISYMTLFTAASLTATMLSCTILRTHLFIWTVFSPKYLYAVAWAAGWHVAVNVLWGGMLWIAG
ncbi:hypothetical protein CAC42_821 [Sphaceloma murrayae]|uniref:GPI ethanolamine phosphate transferase 2 n=1 Tax=Sphaceloma murrayae TaxID=2082308 RepID=A0A2K1QKV3_9PEZI|nr:hypothetical protein CAC42_821 [Sphaceloma murrayae]